MLGSLAMRSILAGVAIVLGAGGAGCWSRGGPKADPGHQATDPAAHQATDQAAHQPAGPAGRRGTDRDLASQVEVAKLAVDRFAYEAFPQWSVANPTTECPDSLVTVARFLGKTEEYTLDPWGTPLKMFCGAGSLPPGVRVPSVLSFGPDKKEGTADDIKSWER